MKLLTKLFISVLIGGFFLYLTVKDIQFDQLTYKFSENSFFLITIYIAIFVLMTFLRALRSYFVLKNLGEITIRQMTTFTCIGYSFIVVLPLRMGEFIIPFLIKKNTGISLSSSLIVILFERLLDLTIILIALLFVISTLVVPSWLVHANLVMMAVVGIFLIIFILSYRHSHFVWKLLLPFIQIFPESKQEKVKHILRGFKQGFQIIKKKENLVIVLGLSLLILVLIVGSIYTVLQMNGIAPNIVLSFTIFLINSIGISLPAGPAMMGNYQYSIMIALSLFSIDKNLAFIFANTYYLLGVGMTILLGMTFLPFTKFTFQDIWTAITKTSTEQK